jgi:cytochrome c-type biogenesis protein
MTADLSLALAFLAGVVSFVSPCVLALLPVYMAYLGETTASLATAGGTLAPEGAAGAMTGSAAAARGPVLVQAVLFVSAFGLVFTLLGISVGLIGTGLFAIPVARQVAGVVVIVLGLLMTGLFGPVLERFQIALRPDRLPAGRSARSVTLGALFALGWSPCIGPVLGAILTLGASSQDVAVAAILLLAYSAGLAVPFLLAAVALPRLRPVVDALRRWHRPVQVAAGVFVVVTGVLIYLNAFARMAGLFTFVL